MRRYRPGMARRFSPDFRRFWAGQTVSQLGSSFTQFATSLLVYKLTHSAVNLGVATPPGVGGLRGRVHQFDPDHLGLMVDRLERKRMMIVVDLAGGGVIAAIPLLAAPGASRCGRSTRSGSPDRP